MAGSFCTSELAVDSEKPSDTNHQWLRTKVMSSITFPGFCVKSSYPVYDPPVTTAGDILFATRTVDPLAAVAEARKTGLWTSQEVRDALWPAQDQRTRPLMPLRRGHMAMLVAAGFLDNLVLEAEGRRILVKGRTTKELVLAEETENTEVYRERLRTTVVALDLDDGEITDIAA